MNNSVDDGVIPFSPQDDFDGVVFKDFVVVVLHVIKDSELTAFLICSTIISS